jgi:hypothetical protein
MLFRMMGLSIVLGASLATDIVADTHQCRLENRCRDGHGCDQPPNETEFQFNIDGELARIDEWDLAFARIIQTEDGDQGFRSTAEGGRSGLTLATLRSDGRFVMTQHDPYGNTTSITYLAHCEMR